MALTRSWATFCSATGVDNQDEFEVRPFQTKPGVTIVRRHPAEGEVNALTIFKGAKDYGRYVKLDDDINFATDSFYTYTHANSNGGTARQRAIDDVRHCATCHVFAPNNAQCPQCNYKGKYDYDRKLTRSVSKFLDDPSNGALLNAHARDGGRGGRGHGRGRGRGRDAPAPLLIENNTVDMDVDVAVQAAQQQAAQQQAAQQQAAQQQAAQQAAEQQAAQQQAAQQAVQQAALAAAQDAERRRELLLAQQQQQRLAQQQQWEAEQQQPIPTIADLMSRAARSVYRHPDIDIDMDSDDEDEIAELTNDYKRYWSSRSGLGLDFDAACPDPIGDLQRARAEYEFYKFETFGHTTLTAEQMAVARPPEDFEPAAARERWSGVPYDANDPKMRGHPSANVPRGWDAVPQVNIMRKAVFTMFPEATATKAARESDQFLASIPADVMARYARATQTTEREARAAIRSMIFSHSMAHGHHNADEVSAHIREMVRV